MAAHMAAEELAMEELLEFLSTNMWVQKGARGQQGYQTFVAKLILFGSSSSWRVVRSWSSLGEKGVWAVYMNTPSLRNDVCRMIRVCVGFSMCRVRGLPYAHPLSRPYNRLSTSLQVASSAPLSAVADLEECVFWMTVF